MTEAQFAEGFTYAEENFLGEVATHLRFDKALIRKKFKLDGKKILDFGCGMGGMSLWYARNWKCEVHAVDIDDHHIEIAKALQKKHQVDTILFEKRNILDKPLEETYDLIFMNDVVEHIQMPLLEAIFTILNRSLNEEGRLFVSYPPWKSPYASHLNPHIKLPWVQFLPDSMVNSLIEKYNTTIVGVIEGDLRSAYAGLNQMTHNKLISLTQKTGFEMVSRTNHCFLNKLPGMSGINFDFFPTSFLITKEFLELQKSGPL